MKPKRFYLTCNKGTETPTSLLFFSTRSYREPIAGTENKKRDTLCEWAAISCRIEKDLPTRRKEYTGYNADSFWQVVKSLGSPSRPVWAFGSNLGRHLTLLGFWRLLDEGHFRLNLDPIGTPSNGQPKSPSESGRLAIDGIPFFVICRTSNGKYKFVDTLNYWREGLVGSSTASNGECRTDANPGDNGKHSNPNLIGNVRDIAESVLGLLVQWRSENCGVFQLTAPAAAMTHFRHTQKRLSEAGEKIDIICQPDAIQNDLERKSLYGGRITCYSVGHRTGPIYHLDVNGLYPYVMRNYGLPRRFSRYQNGMELEELWSCAKLYGIVARVLINSWRDTYPVRIEGKTFYCRGMFWTTLCGGEITRAITNKQIAKIGKVQMYSMDRIFTRWVDYWYDRKIAAIEKGPNGKQELEFCKLMLVSLYGKWAQQSRHWTDIRGVVPLKRWGGWTELDHDTDETLRWRAIAGNAQVLTKGKEPKHAFPAITAFIGSYARCYMQYLYELCPPESIYYLGVDSFICDDRAYTALRQTGFIDPVKLGKLKLLGMYPDCEIYGPNDYRLGSKRVASGHLGNAINRPGTDGTVQLEERIPSIVHDGPRSDIVITSARLVKSRSDLRGLIDPAGWWHPYHLTQEPEFGDRPLVASEVLTY